MSAQLLGVVVGALHEQLDAAAVDDGVVGAAHGLDEVGHRRGDRRDAIAVDDVVQVEVQRVRLVQRTSSTRAAICTVPARLCVGANRIVRSLGSTLQALATS